MPSDDYTPVVRGGLKLKGSTSGIKKKKTKKPKPPSASKTDALQSTVNDDASENAKTQSLSKDGTTEGEKDTSNLDLRDLEERDHSGKTPTERAYEENRRKRLERRLEKEGPKTHKQRVEELNTYLSTLSEHHDMPRIGPG